jgi:hypothetical protein
MSQAKFIGPITITLLAVVWIAACFAGFDAQVVGGLSILSFIAALMAFLTWR